MEAGVEDFGADENAEVGVEGDEPDPHSFRGFADIENVGTWVWHLGKADPP